MPKQLVPDVASFRLSFQRAGAASYAPVLMQTTLYIRNTFTPWTTAQLSGANGFILAWYDEHIALFGVETALIGIEGEDLGADPGNKVEWTIDVPGVGRPGGDGSSTLTSMAAAVFRITGDDGGFPKRGRNFWPMGSEAQLAGNYWNEGFSALMTAAAADYPEMAPGPGAMVIVSRYLNGALRPQGVSNTMKSVIPRRLVGAQRNRRT